MGLNGAEQEENTIFGLSPVGHSLPCLPLLCGGGKHCAFSPLRRRENNVRSKGVRGNGLTRNTKMGVIAKDRFMDCFCFNLSARVVGITH